MKRKIILSFIVLILSLSSAWAQRGVDLLYVHRGDTIAAALHGIERTDHLWQHAGWWNSANIFEALLDHQRLTGERDSAWCQRVYVANNKRFKGGYQNDYYDDNAWWALAWIKAFDLYHDKAYIRTAEQIWIDMDRTGRDTVCGGGIVWHPTKRYKNAITNELYILLSARLAQRTTDSAAHRMYLASAINDWIWFRNSGMLNKDNLVNDGLTSDCGNNNGTTFTYNQGVILGGLAELTKLTGDTAYLVTARSIAYSAIALLSDSGMILTEPRRERVNADLIQFKGIFVRYLAQLNATLHDPHISTYLRHNADSAWVRAHNGHHLYDYYWQGPYVGWTGSGTGAALDLMNAAVY
ncbi:MAG: glycosyl hydrolase [Bacteroidetes bacterium]|nr:glycosyl hydrolase [Bacteroidota bacterium]